MRILQVIPYFYPAQAFGGPARVAFDIGKELVKRGHEVVVFTSDARNLENRLGLGLDIIEGMKVRYFRNLSMFFVKASKLFITPGLSNEMKRNLRSFDIIHAHDFTTYQNIVVHRFATKFRVPYVLQVHGSVLKIGRRYRKWLYHIFFGYRLLRDASKVIALSEIEAREYEQAGVPKEKVVTIPNGIDLEEYKYLPPKGSFRKRLNVEKDERIVLFLGRINRLKGIDFLIEGFAYMAKNIENDNVILVVAGPDDGYLRKAKRLAIQHGIGDRVLFPGPLHEVRKREAFVDASVVASLDSLKEVVFLLVPLEAAACGTPIIVTKQNFISSLVRKGNFGFSVEYGNVPELAETLKRIATSEDLLREMGLNGRKFVFENFHWGDKIDKLEKLYEETVKDRSACLTLH